MMQLSRDNGENKIFRAIERLSRLEKLFLVLLYNIIH